MNFKLKLFAVLSLCAASAYAKAEVDNDSINNIVAQSIDAVIILEGDSITPDTVIYNHSQVFVDLFGDNEDSLFTYIDTLPDYQLPPIPKDKYMYSPIVFNSQEMRTIKLSDYADREAEYAARPFYAGDEWLVNAMNMRRRQKEIVGRYVYEHPENVKYNIKNLPEPPKQYVIKSEPNHLTLSLEEIKVTEPLPEKEKVEVKSWIGNFVADVQFSQAYVSANWYQGGNSNLNLLGNFLYTISLNPNKYPKLLFDNCFQYKIGIYSTPQDSIHSYNFSEDLLQINSKFGVKAVKHWYYTATLQFKTQFFNNYQQNSRTMKAAFLSPGELNIGLGMTYNSKANKDKVNLSLTLDPISYNLKICRNITDLNPENFGIDAGKHTANEIGSKLQFNVSWVFTPNISWASTLYGFSDYSYVQLDWQNTISFDINKYLSTKIFLNLRYDTSAVPDPEWKRLQFKEILSFGFTYKI